MSTESDNPTGLQVAQQIIDHFEPGPTVASWNAVENEANSVELEFTDGTKRKLVGLFAWHILAAESRRSRFAGMKAREQVSVN